MEEEFASLSEDDLQLVRHCCVLNDKVAIDGADFVPIDLIGREAGDDVLACPELLGLFLELHRFAPLTPGRCSGGGCDGRQYGCRDNDRSQNGSILHCETPFRMASP
jgi:hypothetical protein